MEKEMSKIENIKKSISEMESYLSSNDSEDKSKERISNLAEKGRDFIDRAENKANEVADKIKEKRKGYDSIDEKKKERMWKCLITGIIALLAIMSFKKMKKRSHRDEE